MDLPPNSSKKRRVEPQYDEVQQIVTTSKNDSTVLLIPDEDHSVELEELRFSDLENFISETSSPIKLDLDSQTSQFELQDYHNCLFRVTHYEKQKNFTAEMHLRLSPPIAQNGTLILEGFFECPIQFKVKLIGIWAQQLWVQLEDTVRIVGTFTKLNDYSLTIDDNQPETLDQIEQNSLTKASFIIVEPHILIPTTSLVKAYPCVRHAYLSHQFKSSNEINYALILGCIIHEVFQQILREMDFKQQSLDRTIKTVIKPFLIQLYSLQKRYEDVVKDCNRGVKSISNWLDMVFKGKNQHGITYTEFLACEQEFNTTTYGIKGIIDATIAVKDVKHQEYVTALEIKTGKNHSIEHRSQVMIYSLLISERFKNPSFSHILLYILNEPISEGFQYIKQSKMELDHLILGRNQLAKWQKINQLTAEQSFKQNCSQQASQQDDFSAQVIKFPPMISKQSDCQRCWSKEICSLVAMTLEEDVARKPEAGKFKEFEQIGQKLTHEIKEYFKRQIECITHEQSAEKLQSRSFNSDLVSGLVKDLKLQKVSIIGNGSLIELVKSVGYSQKQEGEIPEKAYVMLYTTNNINFYKGIVEEREVTRVMDFVHTKYLVSFKQTMDINFKAAALGGGHSADYYTWTLEQDFSSQFTYALMRQNIYSLTMQEKYNKLRDSIILHQPPQSGSQEQFDQLYFRFQDELRNLNCEQQMAVLKCILSDNYHMVLGTPGSGKTEAIVILLRILTQMQKKVLVVSYTNQALDNVLSRLLHSGFTQFIRVTNNASSADESVMKYVRTAEMYENMNQIQQDLDVAYVFGATCLQMNNAILSCVNFDYCIMDEASQISEPLAIGPILLAQRFVMIGDYYQLNPLVKSGLAKKKGMGVSLFETLCKKHVKSMTILKKQYRMCRDILELSNSIIYHGKMEHGSESVAAQTLIFPNQVTTNLIWLEEIKSRSVSFLSTDNVILKIDLKEREKFKHKNFVEAALISKIIVHFTECGIEPSKITVIAPFLEQQILLRNHLAQYGLKQVLTIDRAQGIDCDVVIISCTKQTGEKGVLLKDLKRLNVAITRAKKKLILIGTEKYLKEIKPLDQIIEKIQIEKWQVSLDKFDEGLAEFMPKDFQNQVDINTIFKQTN